MSNFANLVILTTGVHIMTNKSISTLIKNVLF